MAVRILVGDCREKLKELADESVDCIVSSPPYFGLRSYGIGTENGEIGLEETPEAYVKELVSVFREVRRVLKNSGTLWLVLGDSYAGYHGNKNSEVPSSATNGWTNGTNENARTSTANRNGLKQKDLIGIPWAVATALRNPFYSGRIEKLEDRVWLAAMVDAEGCMFIHKRKAGTDAYSKFTKADGTESIYSRTQDTYGSGMEVDNTSLAIIERCQEITGVGSICRQEKDRKQPLFRWSLRSNECRRVAEEIYPHLVAKQQQARLLVGCPSSGVRAEAAHAALIDLHNGKPSDVEFPPPKSLFEPGYYLRSDIIWSKSNPMPESVTDRPTKAHEYLFLLSKSAKYFYDAEAIKEPDSGHASGNGYARVDTKNVGYRLSYGGRGQEEQWLPGSGRNKRSVWTVATQAFPESHFAVFPPDLIEPCIKAGCPVGGTVLDPFGGAGTTGLVADRLQRNAILIELNPEYVAMSRTRIDRDRGGLLDAMEDAAPALFAEAAA